MEKYFGLNFLVLHEKFKWTCVHRRDCLARELEKLLVLESAQDMLETTRYNFE